MNLRSIGTSDEPALFDDMVALYEYLLVVSPPPFVIEAARKSKNMLRPLIGSFDGGHSIAHLTLIHRIIPAELDKPYRQAIRTACTQVAPFTVALSSVQHFDRKVIYWAPAETPGIDALRTRIVQYAKTASRVKGSHWKEMKTPHLTIAAGLEPEQFEVAWNLLKDETPSFEWDVANVLLLRRDAFTRPKYEVCEQFLLLGLHP